MTRGIPDPGGVSGTFAALERTAPIVQSDAAGIPMTTSMRVANGTRNEHRAVLQLIGDNVADFEEFGGVAFEMQPFDTAGGTQHRRVAILNEEHATLLLTYMRNNDVVRDFKKRLVREFSALRRATATPTVMPSYSDALRGWAAEIEAREVAEAKVAELEPPAAAWNELADAAGDYSVADAAKVLSRDPAIRTGQNRLFKVMRQRGWIYREDNHWRAYQAQVDAGRLVEKLGRRYWHADREEWVVPAPTIRVTTKGLADLQRHLGGGQQQLALAVAE